MDLDKLADKLARRELHKTDWRVLQDVLRDEIRWGTRGEMNEPGSKTLIAIFDSKGDAEKFRRLAIRLGYQCDPVKRVDSAKYEGADYQVEIHVLT